MTLSDIEQKRYDNNQSAALNLAEDISDLLRTALQHRNAATLVVPGGSSPKSVFEHLSRCELDWSKVTVVLTDERHVSVEHEYSNEGMVRSTLLRNRARAAHFISLVPQPDESPEQTAVRCDGDIKSLRRPFDVVFLGMGADAHIASLFPNAPLGEPGRYVEPAFANPHQHWRVTLSPEALLDARRIVLFINDDDKKSILEKALQTADEAAYPVLKIVDQKQVPITLYFCSK